MVAMESIIMFRENKTAQWLKLKSDEEKKQLFKACIKFGREQRQLYKQRKHAIETYRERQILEREETRIKKRNAEKEKKLQICTQISQDGFKRQMPSYCFVPAYAKFAHEFLMLFHGACVTYFFSFPIADFTPSNPTALKHFIAFSCKLASLCIFSSLFNFSRCAVLFCLNIILSIATVRLLSHHSVGEGK